MKASRRIFLHLASATAALPTVLRSAWALDYPTRPVRIIVGFPPGSASDVGARLIGQALSERLGQPFVVENRPGAANNLATGLVAHAQADGYTLLLIPTPAVINATLYENLNFNLIRDIAPIACLCRGAGIMVVNTTFPAKSVPEFIAYAKANPGKINMATAGSGSMLDMFGELFVIKTGVDVLRVPFRGAPPAVTELMAGRVQVVFDTFAASIALVRAGKLRALAVTTATPSPELPGVPALAEFVPDYDASLWEGIGAPSNTPPEIIDKLNKTINDALAAPAMKAKFADFGRVPFAISPVEFGKFIAAEKEKWANVIRAAGIKAE